MQSANFQLAVNLQTSKVLRLTIPHSLLACADEVIEQISSVMQRKSPDVAIASFRCHAVGRFRGKADIERQANPAASVANDPQGTWPASWPASDRHRTIDQQLPGQDAAYGLSFSLTLPARSGTAHWR